MDDRLIAVAGTFVGLAGCEVKRAGDLLVEEDVAHWLRDVGIEPDGEFADVACAGIGIEDLVQALGIVGRGFDNFAFLEYEPDVVEGGAKIHGRGVVLDDALDAVFDRAREDLAVGDVAQTAASLGADALDRESQIGARTLEMHAVGLVHQVFERLHARAVAAVVEGADAKEEVFERLGAHARLLRHGARRPAEDDPLGLVHPVVEHRLHELGDELDTIRGHVGRLEDVIRPAGRDVGVHLLHAGQFEVGRELVLLHAGTLEQFAGEAGALEIDIGDRPERPGGAHHGQHEGVWHIVGVDQHAFAFLQFAGKTGQHLGQPDITGIGHGDDFREHP